MFVYVEWLNYWGGMFVCLDVERGRRGNEKVNQWDLSWSRYRQEHLNLDQLVG
jgi:hypothetical protein